MSLLDDIHADAWVMIITNIVFPLLMYVTFYFQSRPGSAPSAVSGIRVGALLKSPEAWVAGHRAARGWSRRDMIVTWIAAFVMVLTLDQTTLFMGQSVLFVTYILSGIMCIFHANSVAQRTYDRQVAETGKGQ